MNRADVEVLRQGVVVRVIHLTASAIRVGRHPDNDVVLLDAYISASHAMILQAGAKFVIRDLRSRNGTWINEQRIVGEAPIGEGDVIRFGGDVALRVHFVRDPQPRELCVIDVGAGTMHPVVRDRVTFGSRPGCTVRLPGATSLEATMEVSADGEVSLVRSEDVIPLLPGDSFEVGGSTFRLGAMEPTTGATLPAMGQVDYAYALVTSLDAPGGPYARLDDPDGGVSRVIAAENRATVVFVLARKRVQDLEAGVAREDAGWMDDDDVMIAIWGRQAHTRAPSTFAVLVHRIRREILQAGFDPGFFERRRGACRLRLDRIRLAIGDP